MNKIKMISLVTILLALTACGKDGYNGQNGAQGIQGPAAAPLATPDAVTNIVNDYNAWRTSNGQETIDPGLSCSLYTVPNTTTGITAVANGGVAPVLTNVGAFTYNGTFNESNSPVTNGLNVLPTALQSVYQTWFILKCTGYIVIPTDDWHEFDVNSDDGSNLYVDGALVVNNDGLHAAKDVAGTRHLQDTVHSFEIDFFQGGGSQEFIVEMDNALLPSANLWH